MGTTLINELFSMVDPIIIQEMQKYIMKIQSMGVSCLLTDHNVSNLFDSTDRNYVINEGSIIAEGTSRDLIKNADVIKSYLGAGFTYK